MENYYNNGPDGMPRVKRMTDSTLNCIIRDSLFSIFDSFEGEDRDRLYGLMHAAAEEVLARLPAWPATPATSAPSGELVTVRKADLLHILSVKIGAAYVDLDAAAKRCGVAVYTAAAQDSAQQGGTKREAIKKALDELSSLSPDELQAELDSHRGNLRLELPSAQQGEDWTDEQIAAYDRAMCETAQLGEDEPPLPEDFGLSLSRDENQKVTAYACQYARDYHTHMMRKLGDGVSVDTPEFRKLLAAVQGWHDGEPVMEGDAQDLIAHIDAKLDQARAEGRREAIEAGLEAANKYIEKQRAAGAEPIWWHHQDENGCDVFMNMPFGLPDETPLYDRFSAAGAELAVPEGWKLVPVEPTPEMLVAGKESIEKRGWCDCGNPAAADEQSVYAAMLAAAPSPQEGKAVEGWNVLRNNELIDWSRKLDVVLDNGVTLENGDYRKIDWTQVRNWRYSPTQQTSAKVDAEGGRS